MVKKYRGVKEEVEKITSTINPVEMITPRDVQKIKTEWIKKAKKGVFINPVFSYNEEYLLTILHAKDNLKVLSGKINKPSVNPAETFYLAYLKSVINDAMLSVEMAQAILNQDHANLAKTVLKKYGEADINLVQYAEYLARNGFTKKTGIELSSGLQQLCEVKLNASFIAEIFTWAMERYEHFSPQAKAWPVKIQNDCSAIDVRDKSSYGYPVIVIPQSREVNGIKLAELLGHEIECHWRNSQNASILGLSKLDDETVYEGVAKLKDYRFNERYSTEVSMPIPYYVIAQQFARAGGSFAETASYLTDEYKLTPLKSWIYTYRTFRGSSDMSNSAQYAFTKDRAYLEGFLYAQHTDNELLNFGTLSKKQLANLSEVLSIEEIKAHTIPDLGIQEEAIKEIIKRIN